jgi:hypothetical protein
MLAPRKKKRSNKKVPNSEKMQTGKNSQEADEHIASTGGQVSVPV